MKRLETENYVFDLNLTYIKTLQQLVIRFKLKRVCMILYDFVSKRVFMNANLELISEENLRKKFKRN